MEGLHPGEIESEIAIPDQPGYPGRLGIQQRLLPSYRGVFFDALAQVCARGLSVFAGQSFPQEGILPLRDLRVARMVLTRNRYFLPPSSPLCLVWQDRLLKWLQDWEPDALVVEANPRNLSTRKAIDWMHHKGRPVVGWGLGAPISPGVQKSILGKLWKAYLHPFDVVIAYSHRGAKEYRQLGFPKERIFVAPNAVAPRPRHRLPDRPAQFDGLPIVLFVGRLQERKRIHNLIEACASFPGGQQPRLWIVGDGPARQALQTLANNIYPQAEFLGSRQGADLQVIFRRADLFVLPGTGGLAVQEAMAAGLPVIVAKGDGTQEDLVRPDNGWQIQADDLPMLRTTLAEALNDPERLRRMGAESYRIVVEEVNLEGMLKIFLAALSAATDFIRNPK